MDINTAIHVQKEEFEYLDNKATNLIDHCCSDANFERVTKSLHKDLTTIGNNLISSRNEIVINGTQKTWEILEQFKQKILDSVKEYNKIMPLNKHFDYLSNKGHND